jgi:predicted RNA-binding protein with PUA-like domain
VPYLLKTEPEAYSFADLERDRETVWDGVRNAQALRTLAGIKRGDRLAIYHSVTDKAVVGLARVVSVDAKDPKNPLVRIAPVRRLKSPKPLAAIRSAAEFEGSPMFRQFRLSVVPLTEEQYAWLARK